MARSKPLLLAFYGDDFTGSTDALEQLTLAGIRTALFIEPPTAAQLASYQDLQAIGVAGKTRSMSPEAMEAELRPAFKRFKALGAAHVHYKVCSTFDSSPTIGSIGRVMDVAAKIFPSLFMPLLVAAPALGRYCVFGNLFARFGIGSEGAIHRLDRHPSISRHPITPMTEGDLRLHLAEQTKKSIALFDLLNVSLPAKQARVALKALLSTGPDAVLFDAMDAAHLQQIGAIMDEYASAKKPLFSVGSSGVEAALASHWQAQPGAKSGEGWKPTKLKASKPVLVMSGSCSAVTEGQLKWAFKNGFAAIALDTVALASEHGEAAEVQRAAEAAARLLCSGKSVIVHTSRGGKDPRIAATTRAFARRGLERSATAQIFGEALGWVCSEAIALSGVRRVCVAGGDTSSYAARALGIESLEMLAPLTPGAPLCRAHAPGSPANGIEVVFKGGQVGGEDYFGRL